MPQLEIVEIKGNEINSTLWKNYKKLLKNKIKKVEVYSDEEDIDDEDDEEDELTKQIESIDINK